ncbi:MAG: hypothetical protein IJ934_05015 [Acetobacter sp.]|nr:hypothetical protein [Acetobacter sp.]
MALSYGNSKDEEQEEQKESYTKGNVSSLQRMLFLLNRVDAFWRDKDPIASLNKFRSDITKQLHERLEKALPEHKEVIENIELTQICSLPALLAVEADRLWEDPEKQTEILKKLDKKFQDIFPKGYFDEFPRKFEQLTKDQRKDLITQALESSHSKEFEKYLSSYIARNLPELVVGGPVNIVKGACAQFLRTLDSTLVQHQQRTEAEAQEAKECLKNAEEQLREAALKTLEVMKPLTERLESSQGENIETLLYQLRPLLPEIENKTGSENLLRPIQNIMDDVIHAPYRVLKDYTAALMNGEDPEESDLIMGLSYLGTFQQAVEKLRKSPYGWRYESGGFFREDNGDARKIESAMDIFVNAFSHMMTQMVERNVNYSGARIQAAFTECSNKLLEQLSLECAQLNFGEFSGLQVTFQKDITYPLFQSKPLTFTYKVEEDTVIETRTRIGSREKRT